MNCEFTEKQIAYLKRLELDLDFTNIPVIPPKFNVHKDKAPDGYKIVDALHDRETELSLCIVHYTEELERQLTPEEERIVKESYDEERLMNSIYTILNKYQE